MFKNTLEEIQNNIKKEQDNHKRIIDELKKKIERENDRHFYALKSLRNKKENLQKQTNENCNSKITALNKEIEKVLKKFNIDDEFEAEKE